MKKERRKKRKKEEKNGRWGRWGDCKWKEMEQKGKKIIY